MESGSSPDSVHRCVTSNGLTSSGSQQASLGDPHVNVESLLVEVAALRKELSKKEDLVIKLQDRERQLRER